MSHKPFLFTLFFVAPPVVAWSQTAENPQKPSSYVVKKGDCLWNISKRVWGDPQKWPLLFAANETHIQNPNLIYPGQKFTVPTTVTAEELQKAIRLAEERSTSPAVAVRSVEGSSLKTTEKQRTSPASQEPAAVSPQSKPPASDTSTSNEAGKTAVNPSNGTSSTAPPSGSSGIVALILAILAVGGGLFFWLRKRNAAGSFQQPRPLSSFPQASEPPVGKSVTAPPPIASAPTTPATPPPAQTAGAAPAPKPVSSATPAPVAPTAPTTRTILPSQPAGATPSVPPASNTGGFTGTTTNISMSQPPVPSKAEPSGTPSSSMPSAAPSVPPAQKPPENQPPSTPSNPPAGNP